jgi:hypothetical protein
VSGNKESGGKRLSGRTRKGNRWLRRGLCQAAWGASRKQDCLRELCIRIRLAHDSKIAVQIVGPCADY